MDELFALHLSAPRITVAALDGMVEDLSSDAFSSLLAHPTCSGQVAEVHRYCQASRETITWESEWDLHMLIEELSDTVSPLESSSCVHEAVMMARPQNPEVRGMRKSESELALQKLVEELSSESRSSSAVSASVSASASPASLPQSSNYVGEIEQHPETTVFSRSNSDMLVSGTPWPLAPQSPTWSIGDDDDDKALETERSQPPPCPSFDTSVLQAKLYLACAAAAARFGESSTQFDHDDEPPATSHPHMGFPSPGPGDGLSIRTNQADGKVKKGKKKPENQTISSRDDSDITKHKDLDHTRVAKRLKGKNPVSVRSYRRKKHDEIMELEAKIDQLMDERSTILSQFADIQRKHHGAACANEILKTEIETLKEKVNKSEKIVEQLVRLNPLLLSLQSMSTSAPNPTPADVGVAMEPSQPLLGSPCTSSFLSRPALPRYSHTDDARTYANSDGQDLVGLFNPCPVFSAHPPFITDT